MRLMGKGLLFVLTGFLAGCATVPGRLPTTYVSPLQYQNYTCEQLKMEMHRVSRKVNEFRGVLEEEAGTDAAQIVIGVAYFWPALLFLEGRRGPQATEFSRLKGEFEAMEQAAIQNNCSTNIQNG